jgi:hypothetical protein
MIPGKIRVSFTLWMVIQQSYSIESFLKRESKHHCDPAQKQNHNDDCQHFEAVTLFNDYLFIQK